MSVGLHQAVQAVEEASLELGAAERTGDIEFAYGRLCVARERLYERLQELEWDQRRPRKWVTVRFT